MSLLRTVVTVCTIVVVVSIAGIVIVAIVVVVVVVVVISSFYGCRLSLLYINKRRQWRYQRVHKCYHRIRQLTPSTHGSVLIM
jgi:hypothetical protein